MLNEILQDTVLLFIVVDPLTLAVYLTAKTASMSEAERGKVVRLAVLVATLILLLFAVVGDYMMHYFGISISDFMIALGIVLVTFSILDFLGRAPYGVVSSESFAIVPVATPLIAGPAAISTIIYIKYAHGYLNALTSIAVNMLLTYVILKQGTKVSRLLGSTGSLVLDKVISLILAALGISLIRRGVEDIIATALRSLR